MSQENKALFTRFISEVLNSKNVSAVDELMDANYIDHNPAPGVAPGTEGMKQLMSLFFTAFPDLHATIDVMVAEGGLVVGRMTNTGTQPATSWASQPPARKSRLPRPISSASPTAKPWSTGATRTTWARCSSLV